MREIILKVLSEVACPNTGACQINLQSESAQIMIADKLEKELDIYVKSMLEDILCCDLGEHQADDDDTDEGCCGGGCHDGWSLQKHRKATKNNSSRSFR